MFLVDLYFIRVFSKCMFYFFIVMLVDCFCFFGWVRLDVVSVIMVYWMYWWLWFLWVFVVMWLWLLVFWEWLLCFWEWFGFGLWVFWLWLCDVFCIFVFGWLFVCFCCFFVCVDYVVFVFGFGCFVVGE